MSRLADFLIRPVDVVQPVQTATIADTIAVLARPSQMGELVRAVSAVATRRSRAETALVCCWGAGGWATRHAGGRSRSAHRAAQRMRAAGLVASAAGRSVVVELPRDERDCVPVIERACALADPGPLVLALAGARPAGLDLLVNGAEVVVVAAADDADRPVASHVLSRILLPGQRGGVVVAPSGSRATSLLARVIPRGAVGGQVDEILSRHPLRAVQQTSNEVAHAAP